MFLLFVPGSVKAGLVVIDETGTSKPLGKHCFLLIRWIELESIGALNVPLNRVRVLFKRFGI